MQYRIFFTQLRNFLTQVSRLTKAVWNGTVYVDEQGELRAPNFRLLDSK